MLFRENNGRQRFVTPSTPLPVQLVGAGPEDEDSEQINVTITRNASGETTQVVEQNVTTGKTVTTNFAYVDEV
jgi:hypothetical protein